MKRNISRLLFGLLLVSACSKLPLDDQRAVEYYSNTFAYNIMNSYYLWKDETEVARELKDWGTREDAVQKVKDCRYSADRWTMLYEDCTPFENYVNGSGLTYGMDYSPYYADSRKTQVVAVVRFTYADSPARKAGLKRGDVIETIGGQTMDKENYGRVLGQLSTATSIQLGLADGRTIRMEASDHYEDPVQTALTFEHNGVLFGYLHFTNFTLDACKDLEAAFTLFKADGIRDLILDLRYNTGGYVITSTALASMIAPPEVVARKEIFNIDVYNDILSNDDEDITRFAPEMSYTSKNTQQKVTVKPLEVNPGIQHLWVLVTGESASASEALICGLKPYMDVTLVGEKTSGKFCGGNLIKADTWFETMEKYNGFKNMDYDAARQAIPLWGIYVITSRYSDCNGVTLSMPDGIPADYDSYDRPQDAVPLGDPEERMLAATLSLATGGPASASVKSLSARETPLPLHRPGSGVLLH